jgi:hypothetical protein
MTTEAVIRAVGRCALGLDGADRLLGLLEEDLFSKVIPGVDDGAVPSVVGRALLQLYSELQEGGDAQASARTAFDEIRLDPEGRTSCPVEAVIAGLEDAAASRQITYAEAKRLASLPWGVLCTVVPNDLAVSADNFRIEVEAILHEVEDGFVDPGTGYPDVARSAATLVSDLRTRVSEIYPGLA